ncbi:SGNH hydrolase-type esterase and serralysin-like metalloprotease domains-containing protein [Synechococcus sp. A18-46.1]|nr:SGNH hydrolase-type esterase and serralysin-like metalloprotease domains-containing protein [Synechococcus sp. A18-46.1]
MAIIAWEDISEDKFINTFDLHRKIPNAKNPEPDCPVEIEALESNKNAAGYISFIGDSLLDMVDPSALESNLYGSPRSYGGDTASNCSIQMQLMGKGYDIGDNAAKGSAVIGQAAVDWALSSEGLSLANISDLYDTLKNSLSDDKFDTLIISGGIGNVLNIPDGENPVDWSNQTADQMEILINSILADNLWSKIVIVGYAISATHPRNLIQILHNKFSYLAENNSKVEFINTDYLYDQRAGGDAVLRESLFGGDGNHGGVGGHRLVVESFDTLQGLQLEPAPEPEEYDSIIESVLGKGKLKGTTGADAFTFDSFEAFTKQSADKIIGFNASQGDTIAVGPNAFPSLQGVSDVSFASTRSKKKFKQMSKEDYDFVYFEKKGRLYFDGNGAEKNWGNSDEGGLVAILKGKPELTVEDITLLAS